jgi:hypothetical protein
MCCPPSYPLIIASASSVSTSISPPIPNVFLTHISARVNHVVVFLTPVDHAFEVAVSTAQGPSSLLLETSVTPSLVPVPITVATSILSTGLRDDLLFGLFDVAVDLVAHPTESDVFEVVDAMQQIDVTGAFLRSIDSSTVFEACSFNFGLVLILGFLDCDSLLRMEAMIRQLPINVLGFGTIPNEAGFAVSPRHVISFKVIP